MLITVRGYLTLKSLIGKQVFYLEDLPPPTMQDLLKILFRRLENESSINLGDPLSGEPGESFVFLLNGTHLAHLPDGIRTPLKDGDELSIFPPIAGG